MADDGPSPMALYDQAHAEHPLDEDAGTDRYMELMREHGYLMKPGDPGYEQGVPVGICIWDGTDDGWDSLE
jgi:hypothetical protein